MKIITARPHRLLEECTARIGKLNEQGEKVMFLVPAQYTLQAEIEMMERLSLKGFFNIDVLSPGRLQGRIFERAGQPERTIFDERGKCMVLSEIIEQEKENLTVYRSAAESGAAGFTAKVSSLIADFKRSGQTAQKVLWGAEKLAEGSPARQKLMDAVRLYAAYEQRMSGELADAEDVSLEMRARMERSGVMKGQHVFIYGFDMITPTFAAEMLHMARLSKTLTLAVETDENSAPDGRLFAPVNFSLTRLCQLAKQEGIPIERERITKERDVAKDLQALETSIFALAQKPITDHPKHIELRACSNMRAEAHLTGSRMRRMAKAGEELAQMAVVYPKGSGYGDLLASILPMYGVTAYVAQKRPAAMHPLCRFVLSALSVVSNGWRTSDVIECVQSGFLGLERREIDALCSYAEGVDVRGEAWKRPFGYMKNGDEEELDALNRAREKVAAPLIELGKEFASAKTAEDAIQAVIALLEGVNAYDTLLGMRDELLGEGLDPEAEDCAQVYEALMETLDQLHTLLGERSASAGLARQLLEEGLSALELSALPPADGAVICGEIGNVRTAQVRTLFALGMNDAASGSDNRLLTPTEQEEAVRATGAYLGMSASERAALAQLDELKALSGATQRVIISYALADETGRALREGTAVQALRRLFPQLMVTGGLAADEQEEMMVSPEAALYALSVRLSSAADGKDALTGLDQQAYAALSRTEKGRAQLELVTRRLGEMPQKRLDSTDARALYARPVMSVSRLETFAQCPYRHFVRYGLAPQQELRPGVDKAELGTLYHEAAEQFTREVTKLPAFPDVDAETCDRLMDEAVRPLIEEWRKSPLGESRRGEAIARRVAKTARRAGRNIVSQFSGSRFVPLKSEMVFGQKGLAPIMLELEDGSFIYLQGRIDRIDVMDGNTIRVIDYKSGTKKFDPTMAYFGIQLQLLIYLAAALAQIPGSHAAGFFYCRIADPTVKSESRIKEEIEKQIAKKLSLAGISLSDVEVLRAQGTQHAAMITKDGRPSATYKNAMTDETGMEQMVAFARRKAAQLAGDAYAGEIDDAPAEMGQYNACATCDFAAVCGFDPTVKRKRRLSRKTVEDLK